MKGVLNLYNDEYGSRRSNTPESTTEKEPMSPSLLFDSLLNCPFCGRGYKRLTSLKEHIKYRHERNEDNYVCEICHYTFAYKTQLERHIATHKPGRDKICTICGKAFINIHRLQRHMLTHTTGNRKFKCEECGKAFKYKHHLKEHQRIHSGEKPYECPNPNCCKRFSHSGSYSSHISSKKCMGGLKNPPTSPDPNSPSTLMLKLNMENNTTTPQKGNEISFHNKTNFDHTVILPQNKEGEKARMVNSIESSKDVGSSIDLRATSPDSYVALTKNEGLRMTECNVRERLNHVIIEREKLRQERKKFDNEKMTDRDLDIEKMKSTQTMNKLAIDHNSNAFTEIRAPIASSENSSDVTTASTSVTSSQDSASASRSLTPPKTEKMDVSFVNNFSNSKESFRCKYCDQSFPDAICVHQHERYMCAKNDALNVSQSPVQQSLMASNNSKSMQESPVISDILQYQQAIALASIMNGNGTQQKILQSNSFDSQNANRKPLTHDSNGYSTNSSRKENFQFDKSIEHKYKSKSESPTSGILAHGVDQLLAASKQTHYPQNIETILEEHRIKQKNNKMIASAILAPDTHSVHRKTQSANENNSNSAFESTDNLMPKLEASMRGHSGKEEFIPKNYILQHYLNSLKAHQQILRNKQEEMSAPTEERDTYKKDQLSYSPLIRSPPPLTRCPPVSPVGSHNALPKHARDQIDHRQMVPDIFNRNNNNAVFGAHGVSSLGAMAAAYPALLQQQLYQMALASAAQSGKLQQNFPIFNEKPRDEVTRGIIEKKSVSPASDVQSEPLDLTAPKSRPRAAVMPYSPPMRNAQRARSPSPQRVSPYNQTAAIKPEIPGFSNAAAMIYNIQRLVQSGSLPPTSLAVLMSNLAAYDFSPAASKNIGMTSPTAQKHRQPASSADITAAGMRPHFPDPFGRPTLTPDFGAAMAARNPYVNPLGLSAFGYNGNFSPVVSPSFGSATFGRRGRPKKRTSDQSSPNGFAGPYGHMDALMQEANSKYRRSSLHNDSHYSAFQQARTVDLSRMSEHMSGKQSNNHQMAYKCDICEKSFQKQSSLTRHKYEHTGKRPHHCNECGKSFKHKHHLIEHQRLHSGEKPYQCDKCGKRFSHSGSYSQHMNHRYAYCKPEDTMMQELRQQLKKTNSGSKNASFDSNVVTSTPTKNTTNDKSSDAAKTAELARQALYFGDNNRFDAKNYEQTTVVTLMPQSPPEPQKTDEVSAVRSESRDSAVHTLTTERESVASSDAVFGLTPIKKEASQERSDDDLGFHETSTKTREFRSPSSGSSIGSSMSPKNNSYRIPAMAVPVASDS